MRKSEILKEARRIIERGERSQICVALSLMQNNNQISYPEKIYLCDWIMGQLGHYVSYSSWLYTEKSSFFYKKLKEGLTEWQICREGRLQWLDYLIARQVAHEKKKKKGGKNG